MDPVEMKRIRELFFNSAVETAKAIKEMNKTKFSESPKELNRATALQIVESILTETDNVLVMCDVGGLDGYYAEIQINLITNQVLLLTRLVQIAMLNAGSSLRRVLCNSVKSIRDSTMGFIRDIIGALAHGFSQVYTDLLDDIARLRGEIESFKISIQFVNHTLIAEKLSVIKENLKMNAKMMQAQGGILPLMAGRIGYDAASLIGELPASGFLSTDVHSVVSMEELLRKSAHVAGQIHLVCKNLSSPEQIPNLLRILDDMLSCKFANSGDSNLHPNHHFERKFILDSSILGLKSVLYKRLFCGRMSS